MGSRKDPQRTVEQAGGLVVSGQLHPLLHGVRIAVRSPPSTQRHQQSGHQQPSTEQRAVVVLIPFSRCWSRRAGLRDEPGFVGSSRPGAYAHPDPRSRLSGHGGRRRNRLDHRDAGPGGVGRHGEDPARVNQIGIHQAAPVGLNPIAVELEDLLVAPKWVSERPLGNVPQAVVPAALGRLHLVELLRWSWVRPSLLMPARPP